MINIGDTVHSAHLTAPIGTSITYDGQTYTREADGWQSNRRHYNRPSSWGGYGPVTAMVPYVETLDMHKQRFAVTCLTMGHISGGGGYMTGAQHILERLRLEDPVTQRLRVGSWVSHYVNIALAPVGTVLLSGARDRAEGHTLFVVEGPRTAQHLSGPRRDPSMKLTQVVALPSDYETTDWPEPAEDEADRIRLFRIRSWEAGYEEKRDRDWCGEFESAISVLDLSAAVVRTLSAEQPVNVEATLPSPISAGMQCTADLMDMAPVGTIVSEGSGMFTATKEDDGWRSWSTGPIQPAHLFFHAGLQFHTIGEVVGPTGPRFAYGTVVDRRTQRTCVPGAVFAYDNGSRYIWGRSDENNHYGTVGLTIDNEATCTSNTHTTVVWDGISPIHEVPVRDHTEMQMLPVGTVIGQDWRGNQSFRLSWRKTGADNWEPITGAGRRGASGQFMTGDLRYAYIPVPGVPQPESAPVPDTEDDEF